MRELWEAVQFLVCAGIMLGILGCFWWKGRMVRKSKRWPSTMGEIIRSEMVKEINSDGNFYSPKIAYRYSARGRSYEQDTIQIGVGGCTGSRKQAKRTVNRYPVGAQVLVHFDPEEPGRACLERRGEGGWVGYVAGAVYSAILIAMFLNVHDNGRDGNPVVIDGKKPSVAYIGDYNDYSYSGGRGNHYGPNALGQSVGLSQFEGSFVWVEYAAPWCSSSRPQAVSFRNLEKSGAFPGDKVVFLTVMTGGQEVFTPSTREIAAEWAGRFDLDPAKVVAEGQSSRTVPQHALFSPMGQTLYRREGQLSEDQMAAVLTRYIAEWNSRYPRTSSTR